MNEMNREELIYYIWEEKREKIVITEIYPLGMSMSLEHSEFNWHSIIYSILDVLKENPETAFDWARYWGRTIVCVHPTKAFSFRFTWAGSDEEKKYIFLDTEPVLDPLSLLNQQYNIGCFKALCNKQLLSIEGAVVQIERMVDEIVWCNYIRHKERGFPHHLSEKHAYAKALDEVWDGGIYIEYVDEETILDLKRRDLNLPIRLYGNVKVGSVYVGTKRRSGKVPQIVGAVLLPREGQGFDKSLINQVKQDKLFLVQELKKENPVIYSTLFESKGVSKKKIPFVCAAFTLGKKMHAGNLLLLAFAELIRRSVAPESAIFLESNDMGDRIAGMVAAVAEKCKCSSKEAIKLLVDRHLDQDTIDFCYRNRKIDGGILSEISETTKKGIENLLDTMNIYTKDLLQQIGFESITLIPDSLCVDACEEFIASIASKVWKQYGFGFVRYPSRDTSSIIILKRHGMVTASAMRVAFVWQILRTFNDLASVRPIFVDKGESIRDAVELLRMHKNIDVLQIEGTSVGFNFRIGSGTEGNIITAEELLENFSHYFAISKCPKLFLNSLIYFLLTRYATAKQLKDHSLDLSFFDYQNNQFFVEDIIRATHEFLDFQAEIKEVRSSAIRKLSIVTVMSESSGAVKPEFIFGRLRTLKNPKSVEYIFPSPEIQLGDPLFMSIRKKVHQKNTNITPAELDKILIEALIEENNTVGELREALLVEKILFPNMVTEEDMILSCVFINELKRRGYLGEKLVEHAMQYLSKEYFLLKKRNYFYDTLKYIKEMVNQTVSFTPEDLNLVLDRLDFCMEKLGFREEGD